MRTVKRRLVILESPFAGDIDLNVAYARACVAHRLSLGEAPIASHLLYTQPGILRDDVPEERIHTGTTRRASSATTFFMQKTDSLMFPDIPGLSREVP
jgi:hypothetical protein